jgi:monoamine oxidase
MQRSLDAVVVGGGLAGLSAARKLSRAGARIALLEASDRVGGRVRSGTIGGEVVDFGAEWTGPGHRRTVGLVAELGLHLQPAGLLGRPARWRSERRSGVGRAPRLRPSEELAFLRMVWQARRLARRLDPGEPWASAGAERIDAVSVAAWLSAVGLRGDARRFFATFIGALSSAPVERMSLLHLLWWVRRGGGPLAVARTTFGSRVREGSEAIARGIAAELGERIVLAAPVHRVEQAGSGVEVTTTGGDRLQAGSAVLAVSCRALGSIEMAPALPPSQLELSRVSNEPGTKVHALLPAGHRVRARVAFGCPKLAGAWRSGRRVSGFAIAPFDTLGDRELAGELAAAFEVPDRELTDVAVYRWRDHPRIPGCDVAFAPGELTRLGPSLRESHGRVHFAGVERSSWPNNMEGAIESGEHAAAEVLGQR